MINIVIVAHKFRENFVIASHWW